MTVLINAVRHTLLTLLLGLPLLASAAPTAQQVVEQSVERMLGDLKANKERYRTDREAFYQALNEILGPVVDVRGISRSIMTVKYSRQASEAQMLRFEDNFKRSLMQFYGNALLEYDNQGIRILPGRQTEPDRASVGMEVIGQNGVVYPLSYTMVKQGDTWLLRNVIINGINVGKLFRDQFAEAMQRNGNDLDKTIDGWVQVVEQAKDSAEAQQASGR
ncbi:phospholipid transport system substrate-binding protein [Pseudomonas flexibilis]|uniref:Phospholipid transport system substrate-binding protein n=1 Tax=Pseudomonas flexibilis TaxID=706570 RepID=A0A1N6SSQ9_9PSED|nr:phospholipid transport system substrate-binding protein [Pseudomonas flexibilis]SIQ44057.1 phospholipid transport system substrate-binding protein [Pseudomonas flexibilis]